MENDLILKLNPIQASVLKFIIDENEFNKYLYHDRQHLIDTFKFNLRVQLETYCKSIDFSGGKAFSDINQSIT